MKKQKVSSPTELIGEKVLSFKERERRSAEIAARISESYPMVGGAADDNLWRSLNQISNRDLYILTQKRMQDIAFYLYDSNPMAKRIIEIIRDFVIGDGFTYTAEDPNVQELIEEFWEDPDNNLEDEIEVDVLELGIFGELCLPVWVNSANGAVKLGYIDPATILQVKKDKNNPKINKILKWKPIRSTIEKEYKIINVDKNISSKTYGYRNGDCFFFTINKVSSATRGRSDLLTLADWLDGHDQFLFARLERAFLLNAFIWDVTCEGMDKKDLIEFVKELTMPKSGSVRAHNEKIKWDAVTPKLESSDASNEARLFKQQILGGAGYPEHWFASGEFTTRATAMEMSLPTLKKLKSRQRKVKSILKQIINFVIDQAIVHKRAGFTKDINRKFKIIPSPIISRDTKGIMDSVNGLVDGLSKAVDKKWLSDNQAKRVFNTVISQLGTDIESQDQESEKEEEQDPVTIPAPDNAENNKEVTDGA